MVQFFGDVIKMTRGDSAFIHLNILTATGSIYTPKEGDIITFNVRKTPNKDSKPVIKKQFTDLKEMYIEIESRDTRFLRTGEYYYDTEVIIKGDEVSKEPEILETVNYGRFFLIN